ncbi:MAG: calcium-translocating P-type ATPase, PMCA-type [Ruminococcaceae bacterium]|nr:calcium-translocating P-type ATPase, PMCA-type [Oscillospiraceae bacterium]
MKPYLEPHEKVLSELSATENGLTTEQANEREKKYGKNKLAEGKKETIFQKFIKELLNPMILVLIAAASVSAITTVIQNSTSNDKESFADVFIILFVVILNAVLGVVQESKAEQAIEALKTMTAATSRVLRNGKVEAVKSEDLVPGDVILLEAGDSVPADCRILESASLKIEEAALTGESVPVDKISDVLTTDTDNVPLGDRKNMCYMGSTVVYGRGKAVVCAIGMETEMGKIAGALSAAADEQTPLQIKLAGLSKILTWLVLGISVVIFGVEILRSVFGAEGGLGLQTFLKAFMAAISLAVAAIPEGLAAVVTIVLSIGVTKMSKRKAVIRKLTAVETLGCAQVICSDKTGTLTQNKMTVVKAYSVDEKLLARGMALASDAEYDVDKKTSIGEPTECALVNYAYASGEDKNELKKTYPRVAEVPFDSGRKMMTTVHSDAESFLQFTKGAPDELLRRCNFYLSEDGVLPLTEEKRGEILAQNKSMADEALRVLACAYRNLTELPEKQDSETLENDLIFLGLCGMIDPVRPEVKAAVDACRGASIRVVMITGDHIDTAVAIGKELGILEDASQAIRGSDLDSMSDEELDLAVERFSVYARVQPEHKVRIVSAWKRKGKVTAMTGDGVNDAPSIKTADIGIGMGITGTDVTKNVADMILADDNFATIVAAVDEGRKVYSNIQKAIQFLLSSNLSEVIGVFVASMIGFTLLEPVHLLWINLITDSLPALALGLEHGEPDAMKKKPRDSREGIFAGGVGFDIFYQGALVAILTLCAYFIGVELGLNHHNLVAEEAAKHGISMAFLTLSMSEIFQSFNLRSRRNSIFSLKKQNKWLWMAAGAALLLTTAVLEIQPLADIFKFTRIDWLEYGIGLGLSVLVIPIVEIVKFFQRKRSK